jgi:hypothetical protein
LTLAAFFFVFPAAGLVAAVHPGTGYVGMRNRFLFSNYNRTISPSTRRKWFQPAAATSYNSSGTLFQTKEISSHAHIDKKPLHRLLKHRQSTEEYRFPCMLE